jgi:hypothetical protein
MIKTDTDISQLNLWHGSEQQSILDYFIMKTTDNE